MTRAVSLPSSSNVVPAVGSDPGCRIRPVNSQGQLRRGYRQGRLLKAEAGRLVELTRERTSSQVILHRHQLDEQQCHEYLAELEGRLAELRAALESNSFRVTGQVPVDADVVGRVVDWLAGMQGKPAIADLPNA